MKALFTLLLALALNSFTVFAEAPALLPPEQVRRGEPGFAMLVPMAEGRTAAEYSLILKYANGSTSPRYPGFAAPNPAAESQPAVIAHFLFSAPVDAALGVASMLVFGPDGATVAEARILVVDRMFSQEDLRLDATLTGLRVDPDPRKTEQALRYQAVLASVDPAAVFLDSGFMKPVKTERRTTAFGLQRRYLYSSGTEDISTHNGIDYGSPTGSPVLAAGAGRVVMAEDRIVTGKTVILEHLPGAFTIYMHLDTMAVQVGAVVARGVPIGTVGKTGLATGPHLHWEFRIRGIACDPEALIGLDKTPSIRRIVPAIEGG